MMVCCPSICVEARCHRDRVCIVSSDRKKNSESPMHLPVDESERANSETEKPTGAK